MWPKIRCDEKSWKFLQTKQGLARLFQKYSPMQHACMGPPKILAYAACLYGSIQLVHVVGALGCTSKDGMGWSAGCSTATAIETDHVLIVRLSFVSPNKSINSTFYIAYQMNTSFFFPRTRLVCVSLREEPIEFFCLQTSFGPRTRHQL